jgi:hypothetical protein
MLSHHPEVIDYLAPDQVWLLKRDAEGPTRISELRLNRDSGQRASEWLLLDGQNGQ